MNDDQTVEDVSAPIAPELAEAVLPRRARIMELTDALLKTPQILYRHVQRNDLQPHLSKFLLIFAVCVLAYGLIVGSFSGQMQWIAAPAKMLFGTCLTALLCFPSLYILSALSGANLSPSQLAGLLVSSLALTGILLLGFAPVAFVFTFSIKYLAFMGAVHLLVWGISLHFGLHYVARGLAALGAANLRLIKVWAMILVITLLQMSTTLRPILGKADALLTAEKKFFLVHWLDALE